MTTALVTGSRGWVGTCLCRALIHRGYRVVGLGRRSEPADPGERYVSADLREHHAAEAAVAAVRPDIVFHLAAATPQRVHDVDVMVADCALTTYNVCSALRTVARACGYQPRLIVVGSSAQYGAVPRAQNPISERTLPRPTGAYGHAKAAAEALALAMSTDKRITVTAARPFNHIGPGEGSTTVAGALARRVAAVAAGRARRVEVADLEAVRDFTDVRDIARAYIDLVENGSEKAVYNICSNQGVQVKELLETLLDAAGLDWSVVDVVPGVSDVRYQVGSSRLLQGQTGWKAEIPLRQSLHELLRDAAVQVGGGRDGTEKGTA